MVAILLDKINYNKVSKYANVLSFKEFYPKTKNVSYYLKSTYDIRKTYCQSISAEIMLFDIEFYASGKRTACRMHG